MSKVLPALNDRLAEHGCRAELIDLRWGVTAADDDEQQSQVLDVCLKEIERSRPLFVGLLGDRYGWVPEDYRIANAAQEAGIAKYSAGMSVTALEFEHGALARRDPDAVFLERVASGHIPAEWRDDDPTRIVELKARVRALCEVAEYRVHCNGSDPVDMADFIDRALIAIGNRLSRRARQIAGTTVDPVAAAESLFFEDRLRAFEGRGALVTSVVGRLGTGQSTCLIGPSGVGKSSVWCAAVRGLESSGIRVVAVPVGASPEITTTHALLFRICSLLGAPASTRLTLPELETYTRSVIGSLAPIVLAIDGIDQLAGEPSPTFVAGLPSGVSALVSTTSEAQADYMSSIGFSRTDVDDLPPADGRRAVESICGSIGRILPPGAVDHLASEFRTPLWLRLAVGELQALGGDDFVGVDPAGDALVEVARVVTQTVAELPPTTEALIARIIDRTINQFGEYQVGNVLALAAISRSGLRPSDFEHLTGMNALAVAGVRWALGGLLIPRGEGGRLGFSHAVVRRYVMERFVPRSETTLHRTIAGHLSTYQDDPVCYEDLLWHRFRDEGASVAPILNGAPEEWKDRTTSVVLDSLSVAGLDESLRGLDARGVSFLSRVVLERKSAMPTQERIALSLSCFRAAQKLVGDNKPDERTLRAVSNAACCLPDLPSAIGVELEAVAEEAYEFTERLVSRFPESSSGHEARAQIAMWLAREIAASDERALAVSRVALQEWRWVSVREPSVRVNSWLQYALITCASAELRAGNVTTAGSNYEEALPLTRELYGYRHDVSTGHTFVGGAHINIINALNGLGEVANDKGDLDGALRHLGEAANLAESDYAADPDRGSTHTLAAASRAFGMALSRAGDLDASHRWICQSDDVFQSLLRVDPQNSQWVFAVDTAARAAVVELLRDRPSQAADRIQRMMAAAPDADTARSTIADVLTDGARRAMGLEKPAAAFQIASEAVRLLNETSSGPSGFDYILLAGALSVRAHAEAQLGSADAARSSLRESVSAQRSYFDDPTVSPSVRRRNDTPAARACGVSLVELAYMLTGDQRASVVRQVAAHWDRFLANDRGDGSRENQWIAKHLASLALFSPEDSAILLAVAKRYAQHLVDANPDSPDYLADLAGVSDVEGFAAMSAGQCDVAAEAWQQAAEILGTVEATSDGLRSARQGVATNLVKLSKESSISPELSARCLATAAVLMDFNGPELPISKLETSAGAPGAAQRPGNYEPSRTESTGRHPQLARPAALELAVMVPIWLLTVAMVLLVFL